MKFIEKLCLILSVICALLLAIMSLFVFMMAVTRNIFDFTPAWIEEITRYALVWLVMLGGGILVWRDDHIKLDSFGHMLSPKLNDIMRLPVYLLTALFMAFLAKLSWQTALREANSYSPVFEIRMIWVYMALPVGFAFMSFASVMLIIKNIRRLIKDGKEVL